MIKDIRHTGIVVVDLRSSLYFYRDLLGFRIEKEKQEKSEFIDKILGLSGAEITTVKMVSPHGQMIELLKYHTHSEKQKPRKIYEIGISHLAFTVDDLDMKYERLKDKGIKFISSPRLSPDKYAKVAFCRAPEGTFIELVEVL